MSTKMKVEHGDILLFHSQGFISYCIQFWMNVWRWINFQFKPFYRKTAPNHVAMGCTHNNIIEARAEGVVKSPIERYLDERTTITVYRYPWSSKQKKAIQKHYDEYEGRPYQYSNFLFYIIYILSFKLIWLGRKFEDSDKKLYCSELAAHIIFDVTEDGLAHKASDRDARRYFKDYWKISPIQLERWCDLYCEKIAVYNINKGIPTAESL